MTLADHPRSAGQQPAVHATGLVKTFESGRSRSPSRRASVSTARCARQIVSRGDIAAARPKYQPRLDTCLPSPFHSTGSAWRLANLGSARPQQSLIEREEFPA